ncbi:MAG TPA: pre-toxin TG domain-containing protein [Candidatus Limnocylindrales bacterium]
MRLWVRATVTGLLSGTAAVLLAPDAAFADNCGSLSDCYLTARAALAALAGLAILFGVLLSVALDFVPVVGTVKGVIEAVTGRDLITGQELAWWERLLGIVPIVGGAAGVIGAASRGSRAVDLFSASGRLSSADVIASGAGLPRTMDTVNEYSRLGEVDFLGANVHVLDDLVEADMDTIRYLDYMGASARTDELGVQLAPAAFQDAETLVRNLGHESIHVGQIQSGRTIGTGNLGELEAEAYGAEQRFVDAWRRNSP